MQDRTRILHLTDLHLRQALSGTAKRPERLSRDMPAVLARLAGQMDALDADVVVVSGDLLDIPDEYIDGTNADPAWRAETAAASVADYRLFRDLLENLGLPFVAVPGNHDVPELFDTAFADQASMRDVAGLRFVCFRDGLNARREPVRDDEGRALFDRALADGAPQVHVQHYMIDPPTFAQWRYHYTDADWYRDRINAAGCVRALLSGHYHPGSHLVSDTGVHYSVPPAFCSAPFPFRLIDVGPAGVLGIQDRSVDNG
tara:strand:- start:91069 stop:91842 length:774 start_codon:yes stop_codon:yes gene_type:complete